MGGLMSGWGSRASTAAGVSKPWLMGSRTQTAASNGLASGQGLDVEGGSFLSMIAEGQGLEGVEEDSMMGGEGEKSPSPGVLASAVPSRQNSVHWEGASPGPRQGSGLVGEVASASVLMGVGEGAFDGESVDDMGHGTGDAPVGGGVKKSGGGMFGMNIGGLGSGMSMGMGMGSLGSMGGMGGMFSRVVGGNDPSKGDANYADKSYTGLILEVGLVGWMCLFIF